MTKKITYHITAWHGSAGHERPTSGYRSIIELGEDGMDVEATSPAEALAAVIPGGCDYRIIDHTPTVLEEDQLPPGAMFIRLKDDGAYTGYLPGDETSTTLEAYPLITDLSC